MNIRCSYEAPTTGMVCKRWAMRGSNFCYHHRPLPADRPHDGSMLHPLARLADPADIYDVLRETLNAARQGRLAPGQAYAVGYLAQVLLKVYDRVRIDQRDDGLARQIIPTLADEEAAADVERNYTMPLPVQAEDPSSTPAVTPPRPVAAAAVGVFAAADAADAAAPVAALAAAELRTLADELPPPAEDAIPTSPAELLAEINRVSNLLRSKSARANPRAGANGKPPGDATAALAAAAHP